MKTFTAYTSLYTSTGTIRDIRQRGQALRLHPDPEAARRDSRSEDPIVEVEFRIPAGASFVLYFWDKNEFSIYGRGNDFADAYAEAAASARSNPHRALSTAINTPGAHTGSTVVPVARYATALTVVSDAAGELAAA
ncbi:MAG TPA: hypothetical protein VF885_00830 [Arthrobacter sp.]